VNDRVALELEETLATMSIVDCHEHTFLPEVLPATVDLGTLMANSDVGDDMISSGMPPEARARLSWEVAGPSLPKVRNTGFYRSLIVAFQELFGFDGDDISAGDWDELSARLVAANARADWYDEVLGRRGRIDSILRIQGEEPDPYAVPRRWFVPVVRFDDWIVADDQARREHLAAGVGGRASSLEEYLASLDRAFHLAREGGAVGAKSKLAYRRSLAHSRPTTDEAARIYGRRNPDEAETRALEDFLVHAVTARAGAFGLPYQMHVGIGSWQTNVVDRANPLLLNPLIEAHRETTFVLLHGGYPFIGEMATLAKNHPNVYLECGWLAYIAPAAYRRAMGEWLDAVPASKLLGVGADCAHVEQTLGAVILTRRQLALALAEKVRDQMWPIPLAESVARRVLGQNGRDLYRLEARTEGGDQSG
jgi:predicted TIM-barrel fold metal-dependent hydrolase